MLVNSAIVVFGALRVNLQHVVSDWLLTISGGKDDELGGFSTISFKV